MECELQGLHGCRAMRFLNKSCNMLKVKCRADTGRLQFKGHLILLPHGN